MNNFIAERMGLISTSPTLVVSSKTKKMKSEGFDVADLSVGEPDFKTPIHINKSAIEAIEQNKGKYTAVDGMIELKKVIIDKFKRDNNLSYEIDEIMVSAGAKQIIFNAMMATINPGDEVIIPTPAWVSYIDIVQFFGGKAVCIETKIEDDFKMNASQLDGKINNKTKWIILNSPNNPTGSVYNLEELREIAEKIKNYNNVNVMSDDIYEYLIYNNDQKFHNILNADNSLKQRVLTINGVSKSYAMTGWRIGYCGGNRELISAMKTIQSQSTTNACTISQIASISALSGDNSFLDNVRKNLLERSQMFINFFDKHSIKYCKPEGAFYIFFDISKFFGKKINNLIISNSENFVNIALEKYLVSMVHGSAFGCEGFARISFATDLETIEKSISRIEKMIQNLT